MNDTKNHLDKALETCLAGAQLRAQRLRHKRYTFGKQWSDKVEMSDGRVCDEHTAMRIMGYNPATNNLIRRLLKSIIGYYRSSIAANRLNDDVNNLPEIDARTLEEFLISGCAIQRVTYERRRGGLARWVDIVSPARFFINSVTDLRGDDVEILGQIRDMSLNEVVMRFSMGDRRRADALRSHFAKLEAAGNCRSTATGASVNDSISFLDAPKGMCRIIESWELETVEQYLCHDPMSGDIFYRNGDAANELENENKSRSNDSKPLIEFRWDISTRWHCRFMSPDGSLLHEEYSDSHPYVFRFYPLIDGEIHSFVEDVIQQQRNVNRLLTLNDRILSTAAKGVLLFPENQYARDMSIEEAAANWAAPDGVVLYRAQPGMPGPQQVVSSPGDLGVNRMLDLQLRLIEDVSGVNGALKGQAASAGMSASLYDSQHQHAVSSLSDIFGAFSTFIEARNLMLKP